MSATDLRHPHDPEYWMAYLAATVAHALPDAGNARPMLRKALTAFMRSKCCSVHLAEDIRTATKGEK